MESATDESKEATKHQSSNCHASYTLEEKQRYLLEFENSPMNISSLCRQYNIPRPTVYGWLREKQSLLGALSSFHSSRRRMRSSIYPELDRLLLSWFRDVRSREPTTPITRPVLLTKAKHFLTLLNCPIDVYSSDDRDQEGFNDFEEKDQSDDAFPFTEDDFLSDDVTTESNPEEKDLPTRTEESSGCKTIMPSAKLQYRGICNQTGTSFINVVVQLLFLDPLTKSLIMKCPISPSVSDETASLKQVEEVKQRGVIEPSHPGTVLDALQKLFLFLDEKTNIHRSATIDEF